MVKPLFGGGVVLTGALLLSSLTFYAPPSVAKKLSVLQNAQAQTPNIQTVVALSHEGGLLSGKAAALMPVIALAKAAQVTETIKSALAVSKNGASAVAVPPQQFMATAYALSGRTASGHQVRRGLIAADHTLPLGTRVRLDAGHYSGEYTVADRGGRVRGRLIDIWVPSNGEALRFGRRPVKLTVLSYSAKRAAATKPARKTR